jgi:hypothetical protein
MDATLIELSVTGNYDDLSDFMDEFAESMDDSSKIFAPLNCYGDLGFDLDNDFCCLRFKAWKCPSKQWLDSIRVKYPTFKISVFWHNISEVGFIKKDGTEYRINNIRQLKKAVKMYTRK